MMIETSNFKESNIYREAVKPTPPERKNPIGTMFSIILLLVAVLLLGGIVRLGQIINRRMARNVSQAQAPERYVPQPVVVSRSMALPLPGIGGGTPYQPGRTPGRGGPIGQQHAGMVLIPEGELYTGLAGGGATTTRHVSAFFIDIYEVTNRQYELFLKETRRAPPCDPRGIWSESNLVAAGLADHPVVYVTYHEAAAYAEWAGKRLPSETEWMRAAKGDHDNLYPWGSEADPARGNFLDNRNTAGTTLVMMMTTDRSPFSVFGMAGNVQEWTFTPYEGQSHWRIVKGGAFDIPVAASNIHNRSRGGRAVLNLGFRCVRDI